MLIFQNCMFGREISVLSNLIANPLVFLFSNSFLMFKPSYVLCFALRSELANISPPNGIKKFKRCTKNIGI